VNTGPAINQVSDGASFLFRAGLAGAPREAGVRREVSDAARRLFPQPRVTFIDLHGALAAAMVGDGERLALFVEGAKGPAGALVAAAARGFGAFARGDWEEVVAEHERFGGSRAQRDLLEQAWALGLIRVGRAEEAGRVLGRVSGRG